MPRTISTCASGTRVTAIDQPPAACGCVVVGGREEVVGAALLATGAQPPAPRRGRPRRPPVICLRTVEDSRVEGRPSKGGTRVAIVGAGWIRLGSRPRRARRREVTVFETADRRCAAGAPGPGGDAVRGPQLRARGGPEARHVGAVGRSHRCRPHRRRGRRDPDTVLAEQAGLDVDNGVLVDATLRTSDPHIFAIGDIANRDHRRSGGGFESSTGTPRSGN